MSKLIKLTQGHETIVDAEDYCRLMAMGLWSSDVRKNGTVYAVKSYNKKAHPEKLTRAYMHRVIMYAKAGLTIDHIDGDGLNNRKSNLRLCLHKNNRRNSKKHKDGTSKLKGVYWQKSAFKWHAQIKVDGEKIYLGVFHNEIDAARAYDIAARKYFKEFARTNFEEEE